MRMQKPLTKVEPPLKLVEAVKDSNSRLLATNQTLQHLSDSHSLCQKRLDLRPQQSSRWSRANGVYMTHYILAVSINLKLTCSV